MQGQSLLLSPSCKPHYLRPWEAGALTRGNPHPKSLFTAAPQYADVFRGHLEVVLCFVLLL